MSTIGTVDGELTSALNAAAQAARVDDVLSDRIRRHLPALHEGMRQLPHATSGDLADLVTAAVVSWHARSLDLKVHGEQRAAAPDRLTSRYALGAACYADRYAGNLAGLQDEIPYLRELGVSLLHVRSPFAHRADGSVDLRRGDPGLGSIDRLSDLAAALRLAGVTLAVDVVPTAPLLAFAEDLLFLANRGVEAFIIADRDVAAVVGAVLAIGAPGTAVLPASPGSAPLWRAFATGDAAPLQRAVTRRDGRSDVVAVRDAEAVTWPDDADALIDAYTADGRGLAVPGGVAGTTASLAGAGTGDPLGEARVVLAHAVALSVPGVPVLWLGDEVGQLNDTTFRDDPDRRDDPRWAHRGQRPRDAYAVRADVGTASGRIFRELTKLIAVRHTTPEFDGLRLVGFDVPAPSVAAWQRPGSREVVLVLVNAASDPAEVEAVTLSGFEPTGTDLLAGVDVDLGAGLTLPACGFRWLRVTPRA